MNLPTELWQRLLILVWGILIAWSIPLLIISVIIGKEITMKKIYESIIAFALFFLFFIQLTGILIESIYILDLMNTSIASPSGVGSIDHSLSKV